MTTKYTISDDLLNGAAEIAEFTGWPVRRVNHLIAEGRIPVKRIGRMLVARRSQIDRALMADESEAA
jgi:hypothetical protein